MNALQRLINRYTQTLELLEREIEFGKSQISAPAAESEEEAEFIAEKYSRAIISKEAEANTYRRIISDLKLELE